MAEYMTMVQAARLLASGTVVCFPVNSVGVFALLQEVPAT